MEELRGTRGRAADAGIYGTAARDSDSEDCCRPGIHRVLHELAAGRFACGSARGSRISRESKGARHGRARLTDSEAGSGAGRPGQSLPGSWIRVAGIGMLDVPGNESGYLAARRTPGFDPRSKF